MGKRILILPRLEQYGEHRNDHQLDTAKRLGYLPNIYVAYSDEELKTKLSIMLDDDSHEMGATQNRGNELICNIKKFLSQE
ncbi:MAG: hypothetical protein KZQ70_15475 [gamma proteobacterium symbiont of Lucinoma myriamae]|nr:hypothetical protein [gamma proteobacterium symbiont of Lucinoma myriamae]